MNSKQLDQRYRGIIRHGDNIKLYNEFEIHKYVNYLEKHPDSEAHWAGGMPLLPKGQLVKLLEKEETNLGKKSEKI